MKFFILCVLLAGCTPATVRCDAHLQPINAPAPKLLDAPPELR